ncbi:MAG: glycoside hydrolase family 3 C-terminal domain-containing protein [Bacteroidales bacterium]|nr:glycoside hydrolase family 3 C-terminal domain-containing protein [Bacteroidales bacterium]
MKRTLILLSAGVLALVGCGTKTSSMSSPDIEKAVAKTLSGMSLEDKVGQMVQINLTVLGKGTGADFVLDEDALNKVLVDSRVGSILNCPDEAVSPQRWQEILAAIQERAIGVNGIPVLYGLDHIHGCTYVTGSTLFPQDVNVGASFNPELARRAAEVTAYESRACSVPYAFSPTIDLTRIQTWPRIWENFGEDPLLNTRMGLAAVAGYQGEDYNHIDQNHIAVSLKHYMGYGGPVSGKDRTPSSITKPDMREKYFAPYKACAQAGALSIMVNSSANLGDAPFHCNHEYLTEWLKEDLGWDGVLITDWADVNNLYTREMVAKDKKEALKIAVNAGIDLIMEPYAVDACDLLKELVEEGEISKARLDDAVSRILRMKYRLGLFENPLQKFEDYPLFGSFDSESLASAKEGIVLLKNEGALPIKEGKKILVCGPNANSMRALNGGWSYTWQGNADKFSQDYNTVYEALAKRFGSSNVVLNNGVKWDETTADWQAETIGNIASVVAAAKASDIVVACIGENSYCETPGNISDLSISKGQQELLKALENTGKPVVFVIIGGRPRIINSFVEGADAIVDAFLPGNNGGDAIAALLSGDDNFSAKMPYTYPKAVNSLINYDYKPSQQSSTMSGAYNYSADASSEFPFGYGLSYTTFEYSNLTASAESFTPATSELKFTVDVKNTGSVAGKEAVLLFSSDLVASINPDNRRLRDFTKIELQPGETKTVEFTLKPSDLAFVGTDGKWRLEEGDFRIQAGDQVLMINCTETKIYDTPNI